jgi:2-polyprenyl-3-methyl-5-hydroxy-6-metoxy-1,4-benzoquinol methylase
MKEFWEKRYSSKEFVYGLKPNVFFEKVVTEYKLKGSILLPGEGEGRNAIFSAKMGLEVTCFDMSSQGKQKALRLATLNNLNINYVVSEFSEIEFEENSFDVIALIYAHFSPKVKSQYHQKIVKWLKKDGILILEGFSKKQLEINTANEQSFGPKNIEMLYSADEIANDFSALDTVVLHEELIDLNEGIHHKGKASVIRYVGKKT